MNTQSIKKIPIHFWLGLILIILFWILNWSLNGLRTHWGFFPLWLGYCLTIDGLVYIRKGTSLLKRNVFSYIMLFVISAPAWWLFEFFNHFTQNWLYDGKEFFTDFEYALLASLSFSTVMPAVFGTAELVSTFNWIKKRGSGRKLKPTNKNLSTIFSLGIVMLVLLLLFPGIFYVFIWISIFFIIEPVNVLLKNKSLLFYTSEGNWKPILSLIIGCLICGFFWEMWNNFSYPKWIYNVPGVNFMHLFEMPLLGYLGYISFSLELYAIYHFIVGIFGKKSQLDYIQI